MNAYVYRAALYCEPCAQPIMTALGHADGNTDECPNDSTECPKGPYPNGGGEADSPQHCDQCGVFLENPLTEDGREYVRRMIVFPTGPHIWKLDQWADFYGLA